MIQKYINTKIVFKVIEQNRDGLKPKDPKFKFILVIKRF